MIDFLREMLSYPFMQNALLVGSIVSVVSALLGIHLVLKRYAMIGVGLSHVGFGALALGAVLNLSPLAVAIPVVTAASFFLLRRGRKASHGGDSSVALLSTGALALGVMCLSLFGGSNVDLNSYLFGSLFAMTDTDRILGLVISIAALMLYLLFYHKIFAVTFDESFAAATGVKVDFYTALIAVLTSLTVVIGMRMMGTLLISALIIFPPLSAMKVCRHFRSVVVLSVTISFLCFLCGIVLTYCYPLQPGACIVSVNAAVYLLLSLIGRIQKRGS